MVMTRKVPNRFYFDFSFNSFSHSFFVNVVKFPPKSRAVRYSLAGTPNLPFSCPFLVYIADMYGIYKSNEPLLVKKTSF